MRGSHRITSSIPSVRGPALRAAPSASLLAGWTLNPAQARFLACPDRFSFSVGGVGSGKTTAGALCALARALDCPGSLGLIGAPKRECQPAGRIMWPLPVRSALSSSSGIGTGEDSTAHVRVLRVLNTGRVAPVYNLTVAESPEYVASGVLVHNCMDATRYALHTYLSQTRAADAYLASIQRRVELQQAWIDSAGRPWQRPG